MKTAVELLQAEFNKWAEGKVFIPQDILEQAKTMEKLQIELAHTTGYNDCYKYQKGLTKLVTPRGATEYYNETYNQNES